MPYRTWQMVDHGESESTVPYVVGLIDFPRLLRICCCCGYQLTLERQAQKQNAINTPNGNPSLGRFPLE